MSFRIKFAFALAILFKWLFSQAYGNQCHIFESDRAKNFSVTDLEGEWYISHQFINQIKYLPCQVFKFENRSSSLVDVESLIPDELNLMQFKINGALINTNSFHPTEFTLSWRVVPSLEESVTVLDYNTNALFLGICNNLFSFPQKDFVILSRFGTSDYSLFNNAIDWLNENYPNVDTTRHYRGCGNVITNLLGSDRRPQTINVERIGDMIENFFYRIRREMRNVRLPKLSDLRL